MVHCRTTTHIQIHLCINFHITWNRISSNYNEILRFSGETESMGGTKEHI